MQRIIAFLMFIVFPGIHAYSVAPNINTTQNQNRYIVVFEDQPVLQYQKEVSGSNNIHSPLFQAKGAQAQDYAAIVQAKQLVFENSLAQIDNAAVVENRFQHVINAVVVSSGSNIQAQLQTMPDVKYAALETRVRPSLTRSHTIMNIEGAWEQLGGRQQGGEGVFIAIIDTGIDVTHPVFNDEGYEVPEGFPKGLTDFTNNKVIAARIFPPNNNAPAADRTPEDQEGHGTDVASIAAASVVSSPLGVFSGVAPRAYLGNYRIFFNDGAGSSQVIAAINQAVQDGAHVLNMSFGSEQYADPQHDPQIEAIQNAIDLGVTCVIAAGNEGRPLMIGNPQQIEDAVTVNASNNSHSSFSDPNRLRITAQTEREEILSDITANFGYGFFLLDEPHIGTFGIEYVELLNGGSIAEGTGGLLCEDLQEGTIIDDWLLVQRGDCLFSDKVNRAHAKGAKGVIFIDNGDNTSTTFPSVENSHIPSMLISREHGQTLKDTLASGETVTITISTNENESNPNKVSSFSNIGPSVNYAFKPDVTAVGAGSFGATQNDFQSSGNKVENSLPGFAWFDGTSMSTPRVAGIAALIKQKHPDWSPAWVKSSIVLGADRKLESPFNTNTAELISQGGGLANAEAALQIETLVIPPIIGFGEQTLVDGITSSRWVKIVNTSSQECAYAISHVEAPDKPVIVPSISNFILKSNEEIDIEMTMQISSSVSIQDHEIVLFLDNQTTGEVQAVNTWVRVNNEQSTTGNILLVDDDEGEPFDQFYAQLLNQENRSFTKWDVKIKNRYPNLSYMRRFNTVIWVMGEKSLNALGDETSRTYLEEFNARHLFETSMAQYLSEGGSLFLSGQDFLDDKESAMISREVLHTFFNDTPFTFPTVDRDAGANQIMGVESNPVFAGLGPFPLTYPDEFEDLSDRIFSNNRTVTQPAFYANNTPNRSVAMTVDACSYRAVFLAFPLEVMEEGDAQQVLSRGLDWLDERSDVEKPRVTSVSPNEIVLSEVTGLIQLEINGNGFALDSGYRAYLDDISLINERRRNCNLMTATIPADVQPGEYTLRVVTGAGHQLVLPNAVKLMSERPVSVNEWRFLD